MSQRYPDINSPQFGRQACAPIVGWVLAHLPLGIDGRKIDDRLAWDILCYASVKRISIESACVELADAPLGNTTREHLDAALDPSRDGMHELESQLNQALKTQLPKRVCRRTILFIGSLMPGFRKGGHTQSKFLCSHRGLAR
jgi:hypothetical protein